MPNADCPCTEGETQPCGPATENGICVIGTVTCSDDGEWGDCSGAVLPKLRDCTSTADNDCDGSPANLVDSVCQCRVGDTRACETHPQDGIGLCRAGSQTCVAAADGASSFWSACSGSVGPAPRDCGSPSDHDCDGKPDNGTRGPNMVKVPEGYCIDSTEVTRTQYADWLATVTDPASVPQSEACLEWNDSFTPTVSWPPGANGALPVVGVDWCDAAAFCQAAGKRLCGKIGGGTTDYSLFADESESQWYNACSADGVYKYPYGNTYSSTACNTWESFNDAIRTAGSIQTCQPTTAGYRGVYDLVGNVGEWEDSCLGTGQFATCRIRGSSYLFDDYTTDLATCQADSIAIWSLRMGDVGFRCCAP